MIVSILLFIDADSGEFLHEFFVNDYDDDDDAKQLYTVCSKEIVIKISEDYGLWFFDGLTGRPLCTLPSIVFDIDKKVDEKNVIEGNQEEQTEQELEGVKPETMLISKVYACKIIFGNLYLISIDGQIVKFTLPPFAKSFEHALERQLTLNLEKHAQQENSSSEEEGD